LDELKRVSVVITTYNRKNKVLRLIESILESRDFYPIHEIILIDDASTDDTSVYVRQKYASLVHIIRVEKEKYVSECRNIGLNNATGDFIFFIDDDVVIKNDVIYALIKYLKKNNDVMCVSPTILYYDQPEVTWCAGVKHNFWTTFGLFINKNKKIDEGNKKPYDTDSVITAFLLRNVPNHQIKFNSSLFPIGWEDMDFATQIKNIGHRVVVLPYAYVWHDFPKGRFLHNKFRLYYEVRNRILFHRKWSKNKLQYTISIFFSVIIGISYLFLSALVIKNDDSYSNTIIKGLVDGLIIDIP